MVEISGETARIAMVSSDDNSVDATGNHLRNATLPYGYSVKRSRRRANVTKDTRLDESPPEQRNHPNAADQVAGDGKLITVVAYG